MASPGGRYQRLRALASGGMATVYLGRAVGAGGFERLVAIKVMHPHLAGDRDFVSMFLDEARLAASIRHPNVVSVLDVETGPEGVSIVMDYVEGPSLHQLLEMLGAAGQRLPIEAALRIVVDVLSGLHAAHDLEGPGGVPLNLVHRDVSPQNILIGNDGVSRISDFGVAHAEMRLAETRVGQTKGKLGYMSLEHLKGEPVDRRSDVYSGGVVLWELLTGQRLFEGEHDGAVTVAALAGASRSPREVVPRLAGAIDSVCMRALARAPAERWPTAAAFAEALEDAATASGIRVARHRDVAQLILKLDEDGPTRMRPQAADEWMVKLAAAKAAKPVAQTAPQAAQASGPPKTPPPPPPISDELSTAPLDRDARVAADDQGDDATAILDQARVASAGAEHLRGQAPPSPGPGRAPMPTQNTQLLPPAYPPGHGPGNPPPLLPMQPVSSPTSPSAVGNLIAPSLVPPTRPPSGRGKAIAAGLGIGLVVAALALWFLYLIVVPPAASPAAAGPGSAKAPAPPAPAPAASTAEVPSATASASASASAPPPPTVTPAPPPARPPQRLPGRPQRLPGPR